MSIELFWDDDAQTVMLAEFNGQWQWDELHAVLQTIKRLSEERQQIFGAIIDVRQGLSVPGGSIFNRDALSQFRRMSDLGSNGKGPVVIVGVSSMIRTIFDTVGKLDKSATNDVYFADKLDDARTVIYAAVAKLNTTKREA